MRSTGMTSPVRRFAPCAALLAPLLWGHAAFGTEPYRMLSPPGARRVDYPYGTLGYNAEAAKASWATVLNFLK